MEAAVAPLRACPYYGWEQNIGSIRASLELSRTMSNFLILKLSNRQRECRGAPALIALVAFAIPLAAAQPLATFECKERLERDWPRTLLNYQRDFPPGAAREGELRLLAPSGREQPSQAWRVEKHADGSIKSARISFFEAVTKGGGFKYDLVAGKSTLPNRAPSSRVEGAFTILDNGLVAIRLPKLGEVQCDPALPMSADHAALVRSYRQQRGKGIAPGPIQGIRLVNGQWVGGSYFFAADPNTAPRLTGYTCRIREQGPLFVEATVRCTFSPGGWYELTARVLAGDPAIRMDEQFDLGPPGSMWDYRLMVSLAGAWQDGGWTARCSLLGLQRGTSQRALRSVPGRGSWSWAHQRSRLWQHRTGVQRSFQKGFRCGRALSVERQRPVLWPGADPRISHVTHSLPAKCPSSASFRCTRETGADLPTRWTGHCLRMPLGDLCLNWRLRASPHPRNMLHTGEYDPALPLTFCRRQWALIGGGFQSFEKLWAFRAQEGYVTLDDYKDWILDWPADPKVEYPRLLFSKADVERLRPEIDRFPAAEIFRRYLYVSETDQRRNELWRKLTSDNEWSGPFGQARLVLAKGDPSNIPWAIGYRMSQMAGWASDMDELLSSQKLTWEQRARLRSDIAAVCYALSEPDVNPRGSMTHLGQSEHAHQSLLRPGLGGSADPGSSHGKNLAGRRRPVCSL